MKISANCYSYYTYMRPVHIESLFQTEKETVREMSRSNVYEWTFTKTMMILNYMQLLIHTPQVCIFFYSRRLIFIGIMGWVSISADKLQRNNNRKWIISWEIARVGYTKDGSWIYRFISRKKKRLSDNRNSHKINSATAK